MAVASMVLGIIGFVGVCCSFGIPSILATIFGPVAMREVNGGAKSGRGMAIAGPVLGYIVTAPAIMCSIWMALAGGIGAVTTPIP
jgi:hypothetical protein